MDKCTICGSYYVRRRSSTVLSSLSLVSMHCGTCGSDYTVIVNSQGEIVGYPSDIVEDHTCLSCNSEAAYVDGVYKCSTCAFEWVVK